MYKSDLTSSTKTNIPVVFEKDFWPQDEFFKKTRKEKISHRKIEAQKILDEMYEKYQNLNYGSSTNLNELKVVSQEL